MDKKFLSNSKPAVKPVLLFSVSFWLLSYASFGQELQITSVKLSGPDVIIQYDLLDEDLDHNYTLSLYSSLDNYVQPLEKVEGNVGVDIAVGGNKRLVWHAQEELGDMFSGDVALELKGKLYIPFVTLNDFDDIATMKKNRPYTVTWAAGRGSSVLTFDLFNKNNEIVNTYTNVANVGEYEIVIPKDIKPGKNYRFRITDQNNKEDVVFTPYFNVKRKVPLYVNVALFGIAAATGYLLLDNLSGGEPVNGEPELLPDPSVPFNN